MNERLNEIHRDEYLAELADIDGRIGYIQDIMEKYNSSQEKKTEINSMLSEISGIQNDKILRIAVVGEFSSGKSSFINALLREELMETDVIQGTTVSAAVISHDYTKSLWLNDKEGNRKCVICAKQEEAQIKALLRKYTSGKMDMKGYEYIELMHPSDFLSQRVCIIDTPGTNSLEKWHEEVTENIVKYHSDGYVIIISADRPLTLTLCEFLKDNLYEALSDCIFVVTKMDLIPKEQREEVLESVKDSLRNNLSIANPFVLPYSSLSILSGDTTDLTWQSKQSEQSILEFLRERHDKIILYQSAIKLEKILKYLQEYMTQILNGQIKDKDTYETAIPEDLNTFVSERKEEYTKYFLEETNIHRERFYQQLSVCSKNEKTNLLGVFYNCAALNEVYNFAGKFLRIRLQNGCSRLLSNICNSNSNYPESFTEIDRLGQEISSKFNMEFKREYVQLNLIESKWTSEQINVGNIVKVNASADINYNVEKQIMNKVTASHKRERIVSAAVILLMAIIFGGLGFFISFFICEEIMYDSFAYYSDYGYLSHNHNAMEQIEMISTIASAAIGCLIGIFIRMRSYRKAGKVYNLKNQLQGYITQLIEQYFNSICNNLMQIYNGIADDTLKKLDYMSNQYLNRYRETVEQVRKKQEEKYQKNIKLMTDADIDLKRINQHIDEIQSVKHKIK